MPSAHTGRSYTTECARKCSSKSCPVLNSVCAMVGGQPTCTCKAGYVAEGTTGAASLCVKPHQDHKVMSRCEDAKPAYCGKVRTHTMAWCHTSHTRTSS